MPTLAILDGHSLAYRAFYALPSDLATPAGQVTNAVYGFTSMIIRLLGDEAPDALAVAWDTPAKTFRSDLYPEYKAQRESAPDLFRSQLPLMREVASALQIRQFELEGYEADDLIATVASEASGEGWNVLVVTGDRDAFQLIEDRVTVLYTRRGITDVVRADAAYVEERYGIGPDAYPQYAALRGDSSDNLPGVPGVGEKTATRLLQEHGSLDGIFQHLDQASPKLAESLAQHRDQVYLNLQLTRLDRSVPITWELEELRRTEWDQAEVKRVFDGLAFQSLWTRLVELGGGSAGPAGEVLDTEVVPLRDLGELPDSGPLVVEPYWQQDEVAGVVVFIDETSAGLVGLDLLKDVATLAADRGIVAHNAKPIVKAFLDAHLPAPMVVFDTLLAAYVINPARASYDLPDLALEVAQIEVDSLDDAGSDNSQGTLDFEGPDLDGLGRRVVAISRLVDLLTEQASARGALSLLDDIEFPLVVVLARMENAGIGIDRAYLETLGEELRSRLLALEAQIHEEAGQVFNINSTLQLKKVLFEDLELPILKKTPKGQPSTDASVLAKLDHAVVKALLEYRQLEKLRSTYVDGFLPLIAKDGRVHAVFNQTAAATGRLSSERPNLQNIPIRSEEGRTIRKAFVAEEGSTFVVADYSQIELRILAHLTEDPGLLDAFNNDQDIHAATAARVNDIAIEDVDADMRRRAKVVNFGLLYGMEAFGLASRLEIERDEAQAHIDAYFAQFPKVQAFMSGVVAEARRTGYTTTVFGRRRYLPELASGNFRVRQTGERMALNAPIQGSAADLIKMAMIRLDERLGELGLAGRQLLQIHDELVLEVPLDEVARTMDLTRTVMEGVAELKVRLRVDTATGRTLADTKS